MPLTLLQMNILKIIATHRDPESYVAGGSVLNEHGIRQTADIDIFNDREERVAAAAERDAGALHGAGFDVAWKRRDPTFFRAIIGSDRGNTRLEWMVDSDYRFFPTQPDPTFGYRLHPIDLATNKLLACADRFEARDAIDLAMIDRELMPLGPLAWAAADKNSGWSPEGLIAEVRAKARYQQDQIDAEDLIRPLAAADLNMSLRSACVRADQWLAGVPRSLPTGVFLDAQGRPWSPEPDKHDLPSLSVHRGRRGGIWPTSPAISSAMLGLNLEEVEDAPAKK